MGRFADELFIRKAVGRGLRERLYAAPDRAVAVCRECASQLSPLTRSEAIGVIARRAATRGA
jgi:uncharacterized protein with PIN domain